MRVECIGAKLHHARNALGMSARRATQENRFRTMHAQQPLAFARADAAPAKAASHKCTSIALRLKGGLTQPIPHQCRTAQCPLKGTALPANNKPRTKGLPWWNLLANLTVMPLRQPTSKRILPNIQDSWCGFSWACPSLALWVKRCSTLWRSANWKAVPASSGVRFHPSTGWRQFC